MSSMGSLSLVPDFLSVEQLSCLNHLAGNSGRMAMATLEHSSHLQQDSCCRMQGFTRRCAPLPPGGRGPVGPSLLHSCPGVLVLAASQPCFLWCRGRKSGPPSKLILFLLTPGTSASNAQAGGGGQM